jgi:hypothetical protein
MRPVRRILHAVLVPVVAAAAVAAAAGGGYGQQRDTTRARAGADSARPAQTAARKSAATRADSANPRPTARDRVGADDPRCDDLCQRERMMDSVYGKDRERLPAVPPTSAPRRP